MNPQLPPLPEPWSSAHERLDVDIYVKEPDTFTADQMTAYGLQCAEAAVERERARIIAGVDRMSADCRRLRKTFSEENNTVGVHAMNNRLQELALTYGLIGGK